jgi:plastocyanin
MAPRASSHGRLRPLVLAVVVAASLLAPAGISAAEDEPAPPAPAADPEPPTPAPATDSAPPPSTGPASPSTVTVTPNVVKAPRATASATKSVAIVDYEFDPETVTVKAGDTVFWTNLGTVKEGHDVAGDGFESETLPNGGTYSFTFNSPGTYSYICSIHPEMKGSVEVLERSSGGSKKKTGSGGSGGGGGSDGSSAGGSGAGTSGTAPAAGSESAAVSSPGAGGSDGSLPASGSDSYLLALLGATLLGLGLGLRTLGPAARG